MHNFLIVLACIVVGVALRSCRTLTLRKLGALTFLVASFLTFYFLFSSLYAGLIGVGLWFFLPWIDLLTRIRKLRLPVHNRLRVRKPPSEEHFPNAARLVSEIEEAHFDHVADSGWEWGGMQQYFRFFWHPEAKAVAAVCLCEQEQIAFAFATLSSTANDRRVVHTTNYPFSPTLKHAPGSQWVLLPCEKNRFDLILKEHQKHLARLRLNQDDLLMPDPEEIIEHFEDEMKEQIDHNVKRGLIVLTGDDHYRYSTKGLFFLWFQSMKDMIRLC
ncbi:MAG: hypothetical protein ACON38_09370 [Akkermansiaceae bacterium]